LIIVDTSYILLISDSHLIFSILSSLFHQNVNTFIADATLSRTQLIHQLRRKIDSLERKLTEIEEFDNHIFQLTAVADLEAEVDKTDQTNQVIRDARDNFEFRLTKMCIP
jgi:hypothetical protein